MMIFRFLKKILVSKKSVISKSQKFELNKTSYYEALEIVKQEEKKLENSEKSLDSKLKRLFNDLKLL